MFPGTAIQEAPSIVFPSPKEQQHRGVRDKPEHSLTLTCATEQSCTRIAAKGKGWCRRHTGALLCAGGCG